MVPESQMLPIRYVTQIKMATTISEKHVFGARKAPLRDKNTLSHELTY